VGHHDDQGRRLWRARRITHLVVLCVGVLGTFITFGCNAVDSTSGSRDGVQQLVPSDGPRRLLSDDDPCYGGNGWCHIWGDASMNSGYVSYSGSGGASCPSGCLTYKITNTPAKQYLSLVMDALNNGFDMTNANCSALQNYALTALQDGRVRYYDVPDYNEYGVRAAGDAHWTPGTYGETTGAIHLDSREIVYTRKNLAYVLAHEASHILYNIPQSNDVQAQYWGDLCAR
jgi:hypothetical protein